jgi:hypothetical protein
MISSTSKRRKTSPASVPPEAVSAVQFEAVQFEYAALAVELIRALRGRRSCAELSRRMGYRSNVVQRWESRRCWPSAARYLQLWRRSQASAIDCFSRFFQRSPSWLTTTVPESPEAVAAFLRQLKGKTPIGRISELGKFSRYQVSRWFSGATEPNLPDFLCLVEVLSRRLLDLLAIWADPERLPSVTRHWRNLETVRQAAYHKPWSHAVLRALELEAQPSGAAQVPWLADRLGVPVSVVTECLDFLETTDQVKKQRRRYVPRQVIAVTTARDPVLARQLKSVWAQTAISRLDQGSPGNFGYSLFAVSRADLRQLRDLHLEYVRAMQQVIARSKPNECVGLFCTQLVDLAQSENALQR